MVVKKTEASLVGDKQKTVFARFPIAFAQLPRAAPPQRVS
jgi:hypothetical protein